MKRIGPKMRALVLIVNDDPGIVKLHAAELVGPSGSTFYGYQIVNRALRAGLVRAERNDPRGPHITRLYPIQPSNS